MKAILVVVLLTAALAIGVGGCGSSSGPTCESAIGHLYDMGCVIAYG